MRIHSAIKTSLLMDAHESPYKWLTCRLHRKKKKRKIPKETLFPLQLSAQNHDHPGICFSSSSKLLSSTTGYSEFGDESDLLRISYGLLVLVIAASVFSNGRMLWRRRAPMDLLHALWFEGQEAIMGQGMQWFSKSLSISILKHINAYI